MLLKQVYTLIWGMYTEVLAVEKILLSKGVYCLALKHVAAINKEKGGKAVEINIFAWLRCEYTWK